MREMYISGTLVTYLEFRIDSQGLYPVTEKVEKCPRATKPVLTQVLLFKIHFKFVEHFSSTVSIFTPVNPR